MTSIQELKSKAASVSSLIRERDAKYSYLLELPELLVDLCKVQTGETSQKANFHLSLLEVWIRNDSCKYVTTDSFEVKDPCIALNRFINEQFFSLPENSESNELFDRWISIMFETVISTNDDSAVQAPLMFAHNLLYHSIEYNLATNLAEEEIETLKKRRKLFFTKAISHLDSPSEVLAKLIRNLLEECPNDMGLGSTLVRKVAAMESGKAQGAGKFGLLIARVSKTEDDINFIFSEARNSTEESVKISLLRLLDGEKFSATHVDEALGLVDKNSSDDFKTYILRRIPDKFLKLEKVTETLFTISEINKYPIAILALIPDKERALDKMEELAGASSSLDAKLIPIAANALKDSLLAAKANSILYKIGETATGEVLKQFIEVLTPSKQIELLKPILIRELESQDLCCRAAIPSACRIWRETFDSGIKQSLNRFITVNGGIGGTLATDVLNELFFDPKEVLEAKEEPEVV